MEKIFLAINDNQILKPLKLILEAMGITCECDKELYRVADNKDNVAGFLLEKECDIIIVDVCLVVNYSNPIYHYYGLRIASEIKRQNPEKLVIGVTCHADTQDARQSHMDGLIVQSYGGRFYLENLRSKSRVKLGKCYYRNNWKVEEVGECRDIVKYIQ